MSTTEQVARLLALVPWLQARPGATVDEAADWFGITTSQLRQDLEHLDYCGLPGLRGGDLFEVHLDDDRITLLMADELRRPLRLTAGEALRLVLRLEAAAQVLGDELPALRSALDKLRTRANLPPVHVAVAETGAWRSELQAAVADGRQVVISYQGRGDDEPRERTVDPWAILVHDGQWYLAAHDHAADAARSFRLDRIVGMDVLDEPRTAPPPVRLPRPAYEPGPDDTEVVLDVTVRGRWIAEAVGGAQVTDRPDHGARLTFHTDAPGWVVGLVLSAAGDATVVSPAALRTAVSDRARAGLALLDAHP